MKSIKDFINEAKITATDLKPGMTVYGAVVGTNKTVQLTISKVDVDDDDSGYIVFDSKDYESTGAFFDRDLYAKGIHKNEDSIKHWFIVSMWNNNTKQNERILISTTKEGLKEALESKFAGRIKDISDKMTMYQRELDAIYKEINVEFN